jgi:hypothetical protein
MAQVTGTIADGDTVLFQDMPMRLQPTTGILKAFQGEFHIPLGGAFVAAGKSFHLTCSDGRSGEILIKSIHMGTNQGVRVEFRTTGLCQ